MASNLVLGLTALLALVPASLLPLRRGSGGRDLLFWALLGAAVAGPLAFSLVQMSGTWKTGLSMALWVSIAASLALFAVIAALTREGWRLSVLLLPYLLLLAVLALIWSQAPAQLPLDLRFESWLAVHIAVSVATYALCTLAAVAAAAVLLQEGALKRKQPTGFTRLLPSIADAEWLEVRLLAAAEIVLGAGVLTGMALYYLIEGRLLALDHKAVLSLLAFVVIGALLALHARTGLRGRRAARLVLVAYLLITLAYPGVKLVTDVLIG